MFLWNLVIVKKYLVKSKENIHYKNERRNIYHKMFSPEVGFREENIEESMSKRKNGFKDKQLGRKYLVAVFMSIIIGVVVAFLLNFSLLDKML